MADLFSNSAATGLIYRHDGFSNTVLDSFSEPATSGSITALGWDGSNILLGDNFGTTRIWRMSGFSSTVDSTFLPTAANGCFGITWDGSDLISSTGNSDDKIYKYDGFSSSVLSSFAGPSSNFGGLTWDGVDLFSSDKSNDVINRHDGFSSTISETSATPALNPDGVSFGNACNMIVLVNNIIYRCDGFSATVLEQFTWQTNTFDIEWEQFLDVCNLDAVLNINSFCVYVSGGQVRKMVDNVTGLDHLEGETVKAQMDAILPTNSDGSLVDNAFVVTSGTLVPALPQKAAVIHVGLGYPGTVKLLKPNDGSQLGSGQVKYRRVFKTVLKVFRTLGLKIGLDEDHLQPIFDDTPALPLFTGDQDKLPDTLSSKDAKIIIKQEDPLPAYVLAVVNRSEVEEEL